MTPPSFGRRLRGLWDLDPGATFLNHGSFGAVPRAVLAAQARVRAAMEAQPDAFFRTRVSPEGGAPTELRAAASRLAAMVNVPPDALAFVENATAGVQAALRSVPLGPGDEVLITDHTYNAVRLMVEARCAEVGARPRVARLGLPESAEAIVEAFEAAMAPEVRLAIVDHITSPTAMVLPLDRVMPVLRRHGARVIVDGAHAVGQLPLDVAAVGADWYASNAHKWLYAPRGCAFLHAAPEAAALTCPLVVSHYIDMGFPRSFDWVGTRDCSAWMAVPEAIDFLEALDPPALRAYNAGLLATADVAMASIGAEPVLPMSLCASMRSYRLPVRRVATREDAKGLVAALWQGERIQSMAVEFAGELLLRISAQAYVGEEDVAALAAALARGGWPGR